MLFFVLLVAVYLGQPASEVKHFRPSERTIVPRDLLVSDELCPYIEQYAQGTAEETQEKCWKEFQESGEVWLEDVNGDATDELLMDLGGDAGVMGPVYYLYEKRVEGWVGLLSEAEQPRGLRLDILPVVRDGYHDLRLAYDRCLKWNGRHYVAYEPDDYRQLPAEFFDTEDADEAEILWAIRYRGLAAFKLEPHWFPLKQPWPGGSINAELVDREFSIWWVALFKGGVWGVAQNKGFLLLPQPDYRGSEKLEIREDWLIIYGECSTFDPCVPKARYNRRTRELRIESAE